MTKAEKVMNLFGVRGDCPGEGQACPEERCSGHLTIWKAIDDPEDETQPVDSLHCDRPGCGIFVVVRVSDD